MPDPCHDIPNATQLLRDDFAPHEIETVYDLMRCMQAAPTETNFRRIVMLMLRGHYSSALNNPPDMVHLNCYLWAPEDAAGREGSLRVDFNNAFDDTKPDAVPGIYVGFGAQATTKLAIGDHHGHSADNATENFTSAGKLTLKVTHITTNDGDSYDLAHVSSLFLRSMARVFRECTGATAFEVRGYAEAVKNKLSNNSSHYEVVLLIEISYTLSAALSEESHRIRVISGVICSTT